MNDGLELYKESISATKLILFEDPLMYVLSILGNPNKEFYKDDSLFLNYLELGIDI
jgi:hypothetical protein